MKKNAYMTLICLLALMSASPLFAMDAGPLDDLSKEQRQQLLASQLFNSAPSQVATPVSLAPAPQATQKTQPLQKAQGNLAKVETHGVTQQFGRSKAINEVTQGNIKESTIGGNVEQSFKSATASQQVAQGNVSDVKISGAIVQTFEDDDD